MYLYLILVILGEIIIKCNTYFLLIILAALSKASPNQTPLHYPDRDRASPAFWGKFRYIESVNVIENNVLEKTGLCGPGAQHIVYRYYNSTSISTEEEIEITIRIKRRYIRDHRDPFQHFNNAAFKKRYRFTKESRSSITNLEKLLITLRYYGSNCFQNISGDLRNISQPTICRIVKQISKIFAEELGDFIYFPRTAEDCNKNYEQFYQIANFPNVVGTIDCTHIKIKNPGSVYGEAFRNRKGWFSLNIQAVCGSNLNIMDIVIRHPGSAQDALIFDRSSIRARFERNELEGILLGPTTEAEKSTIVLIYQQETQLKEWTKLHTSVATIAACAVLYNIGLSCNQNELDESENDINLGDDGVNEIYEMEEDGTDILSGLQFTNNFINTHFS
ncbi:putative nuclease HARBI1 [Prorops nasuta]|uniref:putative nuclease HARBI1 n=1 Tax=Prorops nasuta TaxID=863751 RepID=UPI0034CDEE48